MHTSFNKESTYINCNNLATFETHIVYSLFMIISSHMLIVLT